MVFIIIITINRCQWGVEGGVTVMWVCASLECKARVGSNTLSDENLMMAGLGQNM